MLVKGVTDYPTENNYSYFSEAVTTTSVDNVANMLNSKKSKIDEGIFRINKDFQKIQ